MVSVQGVTVSVSVLCDGVAGDDGVLKRVGVGLTALVKAVVGEKGSPVVDVELDEPTLVALPTRLELNELALASLAVDSDDRTLSTELVPLNVPVVIVGVVPAKLIVGEVVRPSAPLKAVLTAVDVLIAGVTEERELVYVDVAPGPAW